MLEILKYPDPRLRERAKPVTEFDVKLHDLLDKMAVTMYGSNGIGLAATQVGVSLRVFVVDLGAQEGETKKLREFINPRLSNANGKLAFEEGCLSVPGYIEEVTRKSKLTVHYQDRHGAPQVLEAEGLLAVCIQHETDHLDGILFVERVSPLKRQLLKRKLRKEVSA